MTAPTDIASQPAAAAAIAWLESSPAADVLDDVVPLRSTLRTVAADEVPPTERLRAIALAEFRLGPISREINALLCRAPQPVPSPLRTLALAGRDLHALLADNCETLSEHIPNLPGNGNLWARLLRHLESQLLLCCATSSPLPNHFWEHATRAFSSLSGADLQSRQEGETAFGLMLAISCVQPESFTPWELLLIADVIRRHTPKIQYARHLPDDGEGWFWLEEHGEFAPMPLLRQHYAIRDDGYFFSFATMGDAMMAEMSDPASSSKRHSPQYQQVFQRAITAWCASPHRRLPRRRQSYRVEVSARLGELWQAVQHPDAAPPNRSEWMVQNESAGGLAIVHIAGDVAGLVTGGVVGLRTNEGGGWKICLVRWLRNPDPSNLEIGVELLAPEVSAVRVMPSEGEDCSPLAALHFTYVDGERQVPALLVTRQDLEHRPFTLLMEKGDQLKLASCRFGEALCQTNALAVIAYRRDDEAL